MATGKAGRAGRRAKRLAIAGLAVLAMAGWYYRDPATGYSRTATSYAARMACSCRYVEGRPLGQCKADFLEPQLRLVMLSEDADKASVTARIPLLSSQTATYRRGWGCVLQPWAD